MGQTDLKARVGLVNGSSFFVSSICVEWSLSGSTHFPSQYTLFIEKIFLITWSLGKDKKPVQLPGMSNSMVKSQYAYWTSSLSWNEPTQQAGPKIYIIRNCKIRTEFVYEASKLFYLGKTAPVGSTWIFHQLLRFFPVIKVWVFDNTEWSWSFNTQAISMLPFTCSNSKIETLGKGVKYVQS